MVKKDAAAVTDVKHDSALTAGQIEDAIDACVAENKTLTEKQKKALREALKKVWIVGMEPYKALGFDKNFMETIYSLASQRYKAGLYKEASSMFKLLCMLQPGSPALLIGLAATNQQMGKYEEAVLLYLGAWSHDMRTPEPLLYSSDCLLKLNRAESAYGVLKLASGICYNRPEYDAFRAKCDQLAAGIKEKHGIHQSTPRKTDKAGKEKEALENKAA